MFRNALCGIVLLLMFAASALAQGGEARPVWKIGEFDNSSVEFSVPVRPPRVFVVGESKTNDWDVTQPATLEGKASETATRKIQFELTSAPRGTYRLRIGLLVITPRLPVVRLDVNGHRGSFYQNPERDYHEGNVEGSIFPQYSLGTMTMEIPAEFLRQGRNEIALTAVNDPLAATLQGGADLTDAFLTYDALALDNIPAATNTAGSESAERNAAGAKSAEATPTVFYKRENGKLSEIISVLVRWNKVALQGSITLTLPNFTRTQTFTSNNEFGEQRFEFLVPEFREGTRASINVNAGGRDYSFKQALNPAKKWTVYLVPHEHLDVGYSDFQTKLAETHSRVIDEALEMSEAHPEFRFSLDGYWQAQQFLEGRSDAEKQRFYDAVRAKKIFVPAQHSVMLTGFPIAETLLRSFYASHKLNREHGGDANYANITDVPSYTWSYASIMAASGVKYFSAAANADRGPTLMLGDLHRHSPFYWEGPDGQRVLMWYARHYHQIGSEFGFPPVVATGYEGLPSFLKVYDRADYAANAVMLHGSQWENTSLHAPQSELVASWSKVFAYPELKFTGFGEALAKIEASAKDKIPVVRGDGGPFWEDGIASDARSAALERENERRAVSAEKLATIASMVDERTRPSRTELDSMWNSMFIMSEHTWGWGRSITEPHSEDTERELAYKRLRATMARDSVDAILDRAMTAISGKIETPSRALVVFNTLNWKRDGWVEFDLQKTRALVDLETGKTMSVDVLQDEAAYQRIRFMAHDVPAMGYRTFVVRDKSANATQAAETIATANAQPRTIENSFYRIVLDVPTGAVRSIYDKQLKRELVDASSPYRFNQYVYATGGDQFPNQLLTYRKWSPIPQLETHKGERGKLVSVSKSSVGTVIKLESQALHTPRISTEIVLFDNEKKIEINNRVSKDEIYKREGIYFAFPLAIKVPQFRFDVQSGVVNPPKDMIPGAGLEWFSSQNWVNVSEQGVSVSLINRDSFLWTFGDIVRGTWPTEFGKRNATIFSYVMNNYWNTNYIAAQGGEFNFRYVLTSAPALDEAALGRMGWQETTPLERTLVKSQDQTYPEKKTLPAAQMSFLEVDNPAVVVTAWKGAEDGDGSVLRFIELSGKRGSVSVRSPLLKNAAAQNCNAMEDCGQPVSSDANGFNFVLSPRQIFTMKVTTNQLRR
jgi:hypothetical protein